MSETPAPYNVQLKNEPYTIKIFVPTGNPESIKIVNKMNWTGTGIAFPRRDWDKVNQRPEFHKSGIYILVGTAEGSNTDLPTVYIGQGDEISKRIDSHDNNKDFWEFGYAFVSNGTDNLNRAHTTWLEHALIHLAQEARRCNLENGTEPKEPTLSEADKADTEVFLKEILMILPLLGVRVFEKPTSIKPSDKNVTTRDTVIVPAREDGFKEVFLGENCWYAIRIGGGMLDKIKYIAAYQTAPISAITYVAPVDHIEPYGDEGKYRLVFKEPAKRLDHPIPIGKALPAVMQGPRYTRFDKLKTAKDLLELFEIKG